MILMLTSYSLLAETSKTKRLRWRISYDQWDVAHQMAYKDFIHYLGVARKKGDCRTLDDCLRSPTANPFYYMNNPSRLKNIFADCADLPFVLRAYFSWMEELPFSYPTDLVELQSLNYGFRDIRYSKYGNRITNKRYVRDGDNINKVLQNISDVISTASYRTNASIYDTGDLFRDTYPVDIDRNAIVPGTIFYDPDGHVAIVYDVTSNGQILLMDGHPDNTLSTTTFGEKFSRSSVQFGGGFANFRPFSMHDDQVEPESNNALSDFSLIQYQKGPYIYKGQKLTFYEFVRAKLSDGVIIYNPIADFNNFLDDLCQDVKNRADAINSSLASDLQNQDHPETLPENIYGADGDWETYASPSRDSRLKASTREIKSYLTKVISGNLVKDEQINYPGSDIVKDLREIYLSKSKLCTVEATQTVILNLDSVLLNLFALSFDPYHCVELRWGLGNTGSCSSGRNKLNWFAAEQGLRNRIDRDYSIKTDYDVNSLPTAPVSQVEKPDLSFDKLLGIIR